MVRRDLAVQARDVPELVEQIRRLRTDPDLLRKMERAGESWVRGRDLRRSVSEIQALYAARRPAGRAPVTQAPATGEPVTGEPVTGEPVTGTPVSEAPVTGAPVSGTPVTERL